MQIAILTSPITVGDYRELFSNTSFSSSGPSDEFLTANNAKKVNAFKTHDRLTQKLVSCSAYDDGEFVSIVQVESLSAEEIQAAKDSAMAQLRATRNALLLACDWTQIADCTIPKNFSSAFARSFCAFSSAFSCSFLSFSSAFALSFCAFSSAF